MRAALLACMLAVVTLESTAKTVIVPPEIQTRPLRVRPTDVVSVPPPTPGPRWHTSCLAPGRR